MTDAWFAFRDFVERTEDLPVGFLVRGACKNDPGDEVIAAYDAPYPNIASKAGARAFPLLIPLTTDAPGAQEGQRVQDALREDRRPTLMLWADSDPILPLSVGERFAASIGRPAPKVIENASHFLQEDQGPLIGQLIAQWLTTSRAVRSGPVRSENLSRLGSRRQPRLGLRGAQLVAAAHRGIGVSQHAVGL